MMNEREHLLRKIDIISFNMDDARLFLDTHPCSKEAMCHYEKYHKLRCSTMEEYVSKYGPLTSYQYKPCEVWAWVEGPLPWEKGGNC